MSKIVVPSATQPSPQSSSSWANVVAKVARDGATMSDEQQLRSGQKEWPSMTSCNTQRDDKKLEQTEVLRSQLEAMTNASRQEQKKADNFSEKLKDVQSELFKVKSQLDITRKKLLSLQPPQDIFDDQIKRAFDDLCQNIEDWVDTECGGVEEFEQLFRTQRWTESEVRMFERHIVEDDIQLSQQFPNIVSNVIMNAIFSFVYEFCLREDKWCIWGRPSDEQFLNSLVEVMSKGSSGGGTLNSFESPSGLKFCNNPQLRRWRSDTFKAIKGREVYTNQRRTELTTVSRQLSFVLKHFTGKAPGLIEERLQTKIIETAHNLADLIKASVNGYRLDFVATSSKPGTELDVKEAQTHRVIDAESGIEINEVEVSNSRKGKLRLCVFPGLERVQENSEKLKLSKALVVFESTPDLVTNAGNIAMDMVRVEPIGGQGAIEPASQATNASETLEQGKKPHGNSEETDAQKSVMESVEGRGVPDELMVNGVGKWSNSWADHIDHAGIQW